MLNHFLSFFKGTLPYCTKGRSSSVKIETSLLSPSSCRSLPPNEKCLRTPPNAFSKFSLVKTFSVLVGASTCFFGVYLSYFLDGATGGIIVTLQFILFILFFIIAPKYGLTSKWRKSNITLGNH